MISVMSGLVPSDATELRHAQSTGKTRAGGYPRIDPHVAADEEQPDHPEIRDAQPPVRLVDPQNESQRDGA